jgi:hypothetical protein
MAIRLVLSIIFINFVAIGQQFPESDQWFIVFFLNWNNSQREKLWGQMALNFLQMPSIQWDMDVQMCQPAKIQLGENSAKTHLNIKITEQMEFIQKRGTTLENGFQWGQLKNR